jgi:hypothetical protein
VVTGNAGESVRPDCAGYVVLARGGAAEEDEAISDVLKELSARAS